MKKLVMQVVTVVTLALAGLAVAAVVNGKLTLKAGDSIYACGCGEACPCETLSRQQGKCSCGKKLVAAKVVKVNGESAVLAVNGTERSFKTTGTFQCGCGAGCNCDTISQKKGTCGCGKELVPVGK